MYKKIKLYHCVLSQPLGSTNEPTWALKSHWALNFQCELEFKSSQTRVPHRAKLNTACEPSFRAWLGRPYKCSINRALKKMHSYHLGFLNVTRDAFLAMKYISTALS